MTLSTKLSALTLVLGAAFSSSAFATTNVWDSAAPWGSATLTDFAAWDNFGASTDNSADYGSGGTVRETSGTSFVTSGGNIYSFGSATSFVSTLISSASTGFFDVYLRIGTLGTLANTTATLNGVSATSTLAFHEDQGTVMGGATAEQEQYWLWSNVAASSLYTFAFSSTSSSMSLDQLALATVARPSVPVATSPVPEPETYGMMAAGLGLIGYMGRRRSQHRHNLA